MRGKYVDHAEVASCMSGVLALLFRGLEFAHDAGKYITSTSIKIKRKGKVGMDGNHTRDYSSFAAG